MFALSQTPLILALVVLVEIDHSDHEMISVIRVIVRRLPCAYAVVYIKKQFSALHCIRSVAMCNLSEAIKPSGKKIYI